MQAVQKRATIYLDGELHKALRLKAAATEQSISRIVSRAVQQSLAEDQEDLAAFRKRAKEPNLSFEGVLKELKKRGAL
jgi:hypothetical protein